MKKKSYIYFSPLGGGQEVGASCYFLKLGNEAILLDAGIGKKNGFSFGPSFFELERSDLIICKSEIKHVFISHAHIDHIGFLPTLMRELPDAVFYMTETTKELAMFQLYDKNFADDKNLVFEKLAVRSMFDHIQIVSFMEKLNIGNISVTFYPAGHIPGAMMIQFKLNGKTVLYTGDYSSSKTALTDMYYLPNDLSVDYLINCGLHAKNDSCCKSKLGLESIIKKTDSIIKNGKSVYCIANQISKGIEFLKAINDAIEDGIVAKVPIYIDDSIYPIIKHMENLCFTLIKDNVFPYIPNKCHWPHIILTANTQLYTYQRYELVAVDFSIHDDFDETVKFIKKINPRTAVMVHCAAKKESDSGMTVEQILMRDADCQTQFIFAENEEIYRIS
jgi:Cft2 family RNA processing exonuclease